MRNRLFYFQTCYHNLHGVKSVRIRSYSGPYFPAFGLKTEIFSRIRTEYGEIQSTSPYLIRMRKIRTRITLNTDTFHTVYHGDIEVDYSEVEKEVWQTIFCDLKSTCFKNIHKTIKAHLSNKKLMTPIFTKLCELILVNPGTSCTTKRFFSKKFLRVEPNHGGPCYITEK